MKTRRTPNRNWTLSAYGTSVQRTFGWIYRHADRVNGIVCIERKDGTASVTFFLDKNMCCFRGNYGSAEVFRNWHAKSRTFRHVILANVEPIGN